MSVQQISTKLASATLFCWILCGGISACAPTANNPANLNQVESLQQRLMILESKMISVEKNSQGSTLNGKQSEATQVKKNQNLILLDVKKQLDDKVTELSQQIEQQNLRNHKLDTDFERMQKDIRDLRMLIDQLINPSKSGVALVLPPSNSVVTDVAKDTATASASGAHAAGDVATAATAAAGATTSALAGTKASPVPATGGTGGAAEQLFESGWNDIQSAKYQDAIKKLEKLRKEYPKHPNSIEANYWIAKCYYDLDDYASASLEFHDFVKQNPQHPNVEESSWLLGQSLEKSGEIGLALEIYRDFAKKESTYKDQAQQRLKFYESKTP